MHRVLIEVVIVLFVIAMPDFIIVADDAYARVHHAVVVPKREMPVVGVHEYFRFKPFGDRGVDIQAHAAPRRPRFLR